MSMMAVLVTIPLSKMIVSSSGDDAGGVGRTTREEERGLGS